ncbi:retrotransposon protein, putative, ty1-copia subclass [Tanacetum coccineum]
MGIRMTTGIQLRIISSISVNFGAAGVAVRCSPAGVDVSSFTLLVVDSVLHDWLVHVLPEDKYVKDMELDVRLSGENALENEDVYGFVVMEICFGGKKIQEEGWDGGMEMGEMGERRSGRRRETRVFMDGLDSMLENGPWFIRNNPLILKKWNPDVNLMKEDVVNVLVWVKLHGIPISAFTEDGLSAIATDIGTLLMLDSYTSNMCIQSWGRSSYARALIEIRDDVKLKDTIVVAMPKLIGEGFYTCTVRVEYEWKPSRCACCMVFGHIQKECPKNPGLSLAKNLKKPSQASRGVLVGSNVGFKPAKKYRPVAKKPTANASGNKKKGEEPTKEVSNSNPFVVLNSVVNDEEFGTNGGASNLASNGAILVEPLTLVDNDGKPLKKVDYPGDHDSDDEVYSADNDMARSMATKRVGFGTQKLLDQWRDSYENGDYDEDPYDDDMYEGRKKK